VEHANIYQDVLADVCCVFLQAPQAAIAKALQESIMDGHIQDYVIYLGMAIVQVPDECMN